MVTHVHSLHALSHAATHTTDYDAEDPIVSLHSTHQTEPQKLYDEYGQKLARCERQLAFEEEDNRKLRNKMLEAKNQIKDQGEKVRQRREESTSSCKITIDSS